MAKIKMIAYDDLGEELGTREKKTLVQGFALCLNN
jgi:hypothetical protein